MYNGPTINRIYRRPPVPTHWWLMGTGLMPYKAHSSKYQQSTLHVVSGSSLLEICDLKQFIDW